MDLKAIDQLIHRALIIPKRNIVVAAADDKAVLEAVFQAYDLGMVEPCLIGESSKILHLTASIGMKKDMYELIDEPDPEKACIKAVSLIREKKAEILMKGLVSSAILLKSIVDKETGLKRKNTLSHFALIQTGFYHKLLGITDAAMNINPDIHEKVCIIENAVEVFHNLGCRKPKVAILAPLENINNKIPSSMDAATLTSMNRKEQIKDCIIDGPLALDIAVSRNAAEHKGIISDVAGDADILVVPDLNSGNILYKSLIFLSDGIAAAIITGAIAPIVLTSRSDNDKNKLYSIALASVLD